MGIPQLDANVHARAKPRVTRESEEGNSLAGKTVPTLARPLVEALHLGVVVGIARSGHARRDACGPQAVHVDPARILGGFKQWSQQQRQSRVVRVQRPRWVSANPTLCGVWH